jgi:hypothetical protein
VPNYIARVELHAATNEDYETLHARMQQRRYERTIIGADGVTYQLPTGTYIATINEGSPQATGLVVAAANATGRPSSVVVGVYTELRIAGLPVAR